MVPTRRRSPLLAQALLAGLVASPLPAAAASFPPSFQFRSLETPRITVHYHQGLEAQARLAAALAAEILVAHEARYGVHLRRLHIVMTDGEDDPNGFSTPLPYPLVQIRAAAPSGTDDFGNYEGWLRLVLTHELAHSVHLEQGRGVVGFGRKLLGRAPYLFPNALAPIWMIEGLATYEETEGTAFGRGRNVDSHMVVRTAALQGGLPAEDVPAVFPDHWPDGLAPYLFGEAFLRDLSGTYGKTALPEVARVHARQVIPFTDDWTAQKVTGATFHSRWEDWAARSRNAAELQVERLKAQGLTSSRPLTARGMEQTGPHFSPDGAWIAYTSRTLTRYRAIRLVRPDGSGDHAVVERNGGDGLAWTPDGRSLVYDQPETYRLFMTRSDLWAVDVASGTRRRLSHGLRARDPDLSGDGRRLVFVRRFSDRSELWTMDLDGSDLRPLAAALPEVQWSGPHWSPDGRSVVAARWSPGGWLDLVLIDVSSGALTLLTEDRARDVEPVWTPDGRRVVFRSDRDGVSNLYALRLEDRALLRLSRVVAGAFQPAVAPDGRSLAFVGYSARGYDVQLTEIDWESLSPADAFVDGFPLPRPVPEPASVESRPYRPFPTLLPRFWSPYAARLSGEWQVGAVTGGADPLFRHAYALQSYAGLGTHRWNHQAYYQYDRFWPTLVVTASDKSELLAAPPEGGPSDTERTQQVGLTLTFPLARSFRSAQTASVAWRFKRERALSGDPRGSAQLGGLEVAWSLSSARRFAYSISPVEGSSLRVAFLKEEPALGSDVSLGKLTADARTYTRVFGESDALALRVGGGATFGTSRFRSSYSIGGFPDSGLFDVVRTNFSVLRGYPDNAYSGRSFAHANLEYRFPLAHPQRGYWLLPGFVRHLHGAVFVDAAEAWSGSFRGREIKTGAGAQLGADVILGHGLPLTGTVGLARGFAGDKGQTRAYLRLGLAF